MTIVITKAEKKLLLQNLRALKVSQVTHLREVANRVSKNCEKRVTRRLRKVSMTMRSTQLQTVLDLEREKTPTISEVLRRKQNETK